MLKSFFHKSLPKYRTFVNPATALVQLLVHPCMYLCKLKTDLTKIWKDGTIRPEEYGSLNYILITMYNISINLSTRSSWNAKNKEKKAAVDPACIRMIKLVVLRKAKLGGEWIFLNESGKCRVFEN